MSRTLDVICSEATDIEKEAAIAAQAHFLRGRRWDGRHLWLGIPSSVLAAVAGVTAFSELPPFVTGGVDMLAAARSAASTFLSPGDRAASHRSATTTFNEIRRQAKILRNVDTQLAEEGDEAAARQLADSLKGLAQKIAEADRNSLAISAKAKGQAEQILVKQLVAESRPLISPVERNT